MSARVDTLWAQYRALRAVRGLYPVNGVPVFAIVEGDTVRLELGPAAVGAVVKLRADGVAVVAPVIDM